jgi:hypothetical protein
MKMSGKKFTGDLPRFNIVITITAVVILASCEWVQIKKSKDDQTALQPIARVQDKYLYRKDIEDIAPKGSNPSDSANVVNRYIQNWVKKQLMIFEATSKIEFNKAEIERKILDYQYALMVYEYEKRHVLLNLDQEVTQKEVEEYYKNHKENFQLKQNIIQCVFLQVPKDSPELKGIKKAIAGRSESAKSQLKSLSLRYATKSHLEDTIWMKFDDVFRFVPIKTTNRVQFLNENKGRTIEAADDNYVYLMNIYNYKIQDEISPLEYIIEDIKNIIINKRKTMLARQLEEDIYSKALKNKNFEIYEN